MPHLGLGRPHRDEQQASNYMNSFLSPELLGDRALLREIAESRIEDQETPRPLQFIRNVLDIIAFGLTPILFARTIKRLLSVATFSNDILEDIFHFYYDVGDSNALIYKFCNILMYEMGVDALNSWIKLLTIGVYIVYSITLSSYIVFTFVFYLLCLVLTTTRRWSEIDKFLLNVFKNSSGVFA